MTIFTGKTENKTNRGVLLVAQGGGLLLGNRGRIVSLNDTQGSKSRGHF